MSDLSTQIRAYYDATTTPVDVRSVVSRVGPSTSLPRTQERHGDPGFAPDAGLPPRTRTLVAVAAVVAAAALVAAAAIIGLRPDDPAPVDQPRPTEVSTTLPGALLPVVVADLPPAPNALTPGRFSTKVVGVDLEFDVPSDMLVLTNRAGAVAVAQDREGEPLSFPPADPDWTPGNVVEVSFVRVAGWSTRAESTDANAGGANIAPDDIDGWVAANDVSIVSDREIEIDGRVARVIDVSVDPATTQSSQSCAASHQPCFYGFAIASGEDATRTRITWMSATTAKRLYLVPVEGSEPLLIAVTAPIGSELIDTIEVEMIETVAIGPDAPPLGGG